MTEGSKPDSAPLTPAPEGVRRPELAPQVPVPEVSTVPALETPDEQVERELITAHAPTKFAGDTGPTQLSRELDSVHPEADPLIGTTLDGKYKLLGLLGQGAMGKVLHGEHLSLGIPIAVKVMKSEVAAQRDYVRRFRREAQAMSALTHSNVVRVLDFGFSRVFYIVMEYVHGTSIGDWLDELSAPPSLHVVEHVMLQLCAALEAAHARGIVHRDLKPDNLLITEDDTGGILLKVTDFGLAHFERSEDGEPTLTRDGTVAGTPYYMSPEQCRSLSVGPSTDLYALGCVLTCLLQLEPPFVDGSPMEVMSAQMFAIPPPLARPNGSEPVPELLERLRLELLAKQPHQRPPDVVTVRDRLLEALNPELSAAKLPPRKVETGGRQSQRASAPSIPTGVSLFPGSAELCQVRLIRLAGVGALDQSLITGLGSHEIRLKQIQSLVQASEGEILVMDCGEDVAQALSWLESLTDQPPAPPCIVYAAAPDAAEVSALIEAGAAEVARYPLAAESLSRRIVRLRRRAARAASRG